MFDDPNKELAELQAQLEAQEEWFRRELDSAKRMIGQEPERKAAPAAPVRNYANGYGRNLPRQEGQHQSHRQKECRLHQLLTIFHSQNTIFLSFVSSRIPHLSGVRNPHSHQFFPDIQNP